MQAFQEYLTSILLHIMSETLGWIHIGWNLISMFKIQDGKAHWTLHDILHEYDIF